MDYCSIVVHMDDNEASNERLALACRVARRFEVKLIGMYIVPTREMTPFTSAILPDTVVEHRLRDSGLAQARAEQRFVEATAEAGLVDTEFRAPAGPPFEAATFNVRHADLAIIGQPQPDDLHPTFLRDLAHAALIGSGRPALVVPYAGTFAMPGASVLIAWKESRESARAVADALPWLRASGRVMVLSVRTDDDDPFETLGEKGIAQFLQCHGVVAEVQHEVAADIDVPPLLMSRATDLGSDLLVMGAYSHSPLQERMFGGTTQTILESMTLPVLLSH
jgi:nucleotide-binding universal stress UspA family protein